MKLSFARKTMVILAVLLFSVFTTEGPFSIRGDFSHRVEAATAVYKTTTDLNMRTDASTKHKAMSIIPKGKEVTYVSKSGSWFKIKYGKKTGFVNSKHLKKVSASTSKTRVKKATAKKTTSKQAAVKKPATVKQYQTTKSLTMLTGASTKHKVMTTISKGKKVTYVSKSGSWFKVKYGKKTGFVSSKHLKKVPASTHKTPAAKKKPIKKETVKKPATSKQYQTTTNLNMRTGSSTKHKVMTKIPKDKKVTYVSKSGSWYKVKYDNKTGFVSSKYLKEPSKVITKPTYVKGVLMASKKYSLPSNFAPGESKEARTAFNKMAKEAKKQGYQLTAFSTYRSYAVQKQLYASYVARDGKAAADRYSAKAGTSEHQTGLSFDIGEVGKHSNRFNESNATRWMAKNSYKYGFIVRYPKGKEKITGYMYEPWHLRYLGVDVATKVHKSGVTLEEYLGIK